jgi:hypothetical protein
VLWNQRVGTADLRRRQSLADVGDGGEPDDGGAEPEGDAERDPEGKFHDMGDAKGIVIRGQLWGHNDMPFGRPTPGQPQGVWCF